MGQEIWRLSAAETARRIAAGDLSAAAATEAALDRIAEVNGQLNAVIDDQAAAARAAAAALDAAFAKSGPVGPLHGVPVTIKCNVDQAGEATTNGVPAFANMIAAEDAPVTAALRAAGAVIVGRTNTPEFSFRADTDNPLYGRTFNPWDRRLSPGGSSGGASSAVMAGMCGLAHGNDIGGSLRFPAAATGAATVKPGLGRVPAYNPSQAEERGMLAQQMSVQGVIARDVADVRLGLSALIGADVRDPWHNALPLAHPGAGPEGGPEGGPIRVAVTRRSFEHTLHPDIAAALDAAEAALSAAGYVLEAVDPPDVRAAGMDGYRALMGETRALMGPMIARFGSPTIQAIFHEYFRAFPPFEGDALLKAMARRSKHARDWAVFMETYPLILTPFLPTPTYRCDQDAEGWLGVRQVLGAGVYSYAMNYLGLPAGVIPAGMSDGAPVSIQIVGRRWREDQVLDACEAVEGAVGVMADRLFDRGLDLG